MGERSTAEAGDMMGEEHKLKMLPLNLLERDRLLCFIRNKEGGDPLAMKIHRVIEESDSAVALDVMSMGILHGILEKHEAWNIWGLGSVYKKIIDIKLQTEREDGVVKTWLSNGQIMLEDVDGTIIIREPLHFELTEEQR